MRNRRYLESRLYSRFIDLHVFDSFDGRTQIPVPSPNAHLARFCVSPKLFSVMADSTPKSYHTDPTLYLYTSLTAGSSHIITATSRLETILKANQIPFRALDVATDEKARMLWGRRAGKRKLPGLVRAGTIVGVRLQSLGPVGHDAIAEAACRILRKWRSGMSTAS